MRRRAVVCPILLTLGGCLLDAEPTEPPQGGGGAGPGFGIGGHVWPENALSSGRSDDATAPDDSDSDGAVVVEDTDLWSRTDTDPADTDGTPPRPALPGRFVPVTGDLEAAYPPVEPGQPLVPVRPELTTLVVGDIDEDGLPDTVSTIVNLVGGPPVTRVTHLDATFTTSTDDAVLRDGIADGDAIGAAIGLIDLDGDGHLDLVTSKADAPVRWGTGTGTFEAGQPIGGFVGSNWSSSPSLWDVDGDGWNDLLFGPTADAGPVRYAQRTGPRTWAEVPGVVGTRNGDARLIGIQSFAQAGTQIHLLVGEGAQTISPNPGWLVGLHPRGIWLNAADWIARPIWWQQLPAYASAGILDVAAMGATVADLDADGWQDLVLSPGFVKMATFRGGPAGFVGSPTIGELTFPALEPAEVPLPWSVAVIDLDLDGTAEVIATFGDDASSFSLARGAHQRNRIWRRNPAGTWDEIGADLGFDQPDGWMAMNVIDLDHDGDADAALGGDGRGPRLLRNDIDSGQHAISLRLIGTSSNPLALGAEVSLDADGLATQRQQVLLRTAPWAIADPLLFYGLATATRAREVRIAWPSGWTQVVPDLAGGALHEIVEPPVFTITPSDRRAPADGVSRITIDVTPRLTDGSLDRSSPVTVSLDGPGAVMANAGWVGDVWRAQIEAPVVPGSTRVRIQAGATSYAVQPRLVWD